MKEQYDMTAKIRNGLRRQWLVSMTPCIAQKSIWREMERARAGFCENCANGSHDENQSDDFT
jgi:hypothetical protein